MKGGIRRIQALLSGSQWQDKWQWAQSETLKEKQKEEGHKEKQN